jgi:hypothetical protein
LTLNGDPWISQQRSQPLVEPILLTVLSDEVQHRQAVLTRPGRQSKPTAKLLQKHGQAVCGPHEQHRVNLRDVNSFIEQVRNENKLRLSAPQPANHLVTSLKVI